MSGKDLFEAWQTIKGIVDDALDSKPNVRSVRAGRSGAGARKKTSERTTLPEHIIKLRDSGFFREPRSATEVHVKLQATYHCAVDRVVMALLRLKNARKLRKTTKVVGKKKLIAYVW